jgi:superfamily I DNA and/or RNA helicase
MNILKTYQKRLTNLTNRNKSLLLLSLSQRNFLDIHQLDFLNHQSSFSIVENLIKGIPKTLLCPQVDSRNKFANQVSPILKNIQRTDHFIQEENGAKNLFVGYPIIEGKLLDDTLIRCPLLFFPVEICLENNHWLLQLRDNESITFNKTFLLAYSFFNKIQFNEDFLGQDFENDEWANVRKDSRHFRTELYNYLQNNNLEINFNVENFTDTLHYFTKQSKSEFDLFHQTGKLKLHPQAILGIFPQADSYLAPDYDFLLHQEITIPQLWGGNNLPPSSSLLWERRHEASNVFPYSLDASQEKALLIIKSGQSIVIQGPPGTGKSQLICNLATDSIANGKTVLVVCQKKAALDVVHQRLSEKQVQNFTALVHDFQYDKKIIYAQLNAQIEKIYEKSEQKISLEALHYEEKFLQLNRQIEQNAKALTDFKNALFDTTECGLSVKELYLTSDKNAPQIPIKEYQYFHFSTYQDFLDKLDLYEKYAKTMEKPDYEWLDRVSFAHFTGEDVGEIKNCLNEIGIQKKQAVFSPQDARNFCNHWETLQQIVDALTNPPIFKFFQISLKYDKNKLEWLEEIEKKVRNIFDSNAVEKTLKISELSFYKNELEKYKIMQTSFFKNLKYYFSKEYKLLKILAKDNHLILKKDVSFLLKKVDTRLHLEALKNEMLSGESVINKPIEELEYRDILNHWTLEVPQTLERQDFDAWFAEYKNGIKIYKKFNKIMKMTSFKTMSFLLKKLFLSDYLTLKTDFEKFAKSNSRLFEKYKIWKKYLTENQIAILWEKPYLANEWIAILMRDFELLCEFDQLKKSMTKQQLNIVGQLSNQKRLGESLTNGDVFSTIFDNSLRLAWIEHIEKQHPILKSISTPKFEQIEKNLQKAVQEKRKISEEILLPRAYEYACKELEYNRLKNLVSYRELKHQVSKKRNAWALRRLIAHFKSEIFKLIPCWLCSPETVSAIFPMEKIFDLVIFDEASQCFAEKGIPSMYRGMQIVIVGDDKQLTPTDLYHIRWEEKVDEEDGNIALETDSLLDLGRQFLPITSLTGHYRSKSLDLIDFSNQYFYNNKLKLLPDYDEFITSEPAISYIKVNGGWEKNTNLIEALEVVKVIKQYLEKDKKDIGVITFNYKQQLLIQDLLEEEKIALPPLLFIKNIENVQGDERDIIIFSTTYAPDARGRMKMQFGSLNLQGGENRMNVAVTRAREKIVVISSIFPHQLNVEDLTNEGAKILKKYLEYALEVSQGKYQPTLPALPKQNIEWYLKEKIKVAWGTEVVAMAGNIPFADGVIHSALAKLKLVLTDDNLYYEALSIKESHVYLPNLLKKKGWEFVQVYSRNWWLMEDKSAFLKNL